MPRGKRLKVKGEIAHYHIISRTVGQQFLLGETEKDELVRLIRYFSKMYFVKVNAYCIMSNHFHLVIRALPERMYSDKEVVRRILTYMDKSKKGKWKKKKKPEEITPQKIREAREKLEDISEFCRSFKQAFSRGYNKPRDRSGYFWSERFKSVLLEAGDSVQRCSAYVELNPVRAGIVTKPESYRWCSMHNRQFAPRRHRFCSYDGIFEEDDQSNCSEAFLLKEYRSIVYYLVYYLGNIKRTTLKDIEEGRTTDDARSPISDELYTETIRRDFKLPTSERLLGRVRYFTDGAVIGSKDFLIQAYATFAGTAIFKKDRSLYPTGITPTLFSIKRLRPKLN